MNILMTGATGFVGKHLGHQLIQKGHKLKILTRNKSQSAQNQEGPITYFQWSNPESETPPQEAFKDIDAVINLMGENLSEKRWSNNQSSKYLLCFKYTYIYLKFD